MKGHRRPLLKGGLCQNIFRIRQRFHVPEEKVKGANHIEVKDIYDM